MAVAAADYSREYESGKQNAYGVEAAEIIYDGTMGGFNGSAYARALNAGDEYAGFNKSGRVDNGDGAAGDLEVILDESVHVEMAVVGVTGPEDAGMWVYATDDQTLTISPGAPGASTRVGKVSRYVSAAVAIVHLYVEADDDPEYDVAVSAPVPAEITTAGAVTLTAAQIMASFLKADPSGAARTYTLPTAALLVAALKKAHVGQRLVFQIQNTADAAETITVAEGAGGTADGDSTLTAAQNNSTKFMIVLTNVTAAAEAYTLYGLGTRVH
jgi:hypothetical protein